MPIATRFFSTALLALGGTFIMTGPTNSQPLPIEVQKEELRTLLDGKRVGFLTNPTSVDHDYRHLADWMHGDEGIDLVCLFAPEHGLRGDNQAGSGEGDYTDTVTGLPVYTLYGTRNAPTDAQLATIDVLVFDIQDVGTRFYTYVWTMTHAMEACARNNKDFVVLDRPNPAGADRVEGAPNPNDEGLIGRKWPGAPFGVATRHGLTAGELATLVNAEWMDPKVTLSVVTVPGYKRAMTFRETGYPWVIPSPNMPTLDTVLVYSGTGIFEGANISEGRGTTRPFEFIGAPYINGTAYADALNALNLPGVRFRAAWFQPTFDDFAGQACGGVQVHVTDPAAFQSVYTGMAMLKTAVTLYPDNVQVKAWATRLMGIPGLETSIATTSVDGLVAGYQANLDLYLEMRSRHLLYD